MSGDEDDNNYDDDDDDDDVDDDDNDHDDNDDHDGRETAEDHSCWTGGERTDNVRDKLSTSEGLHVFCFSSLSPDWSGLLRIQMCSSRFSG